MFVYLHKFTPSFLCNRTKIKKVCYRFRFFMTCRVTRIIRTSFLATNIRHQFVKRLECIDIQSSAFSCCWQIFVSQKISDPRALIFRWFLVRRTTQGINLARTTSRKAPKIKALRSEIFWLTNICQQQENAEDSILIRSRRLTNWWRIFVAKKLVRIILVTLIYIAIRNILLK